MYRKYCCVAFVSCRIIRTVNDDASSPETRSHMCRAGLQKLLVCNFKPKCICNVEDQSTGGSIATVDLNMKINWTSDPSPYPRQSVVVGVGGEGAIIPRPLPVLRAYKVDYVITFLHFELYPPFFALVKWGFVVYSFLKAKVMYIC